MPEPGEYADMIYYSGKSLNDMGNYSACNSLEHARYVLVDMSEQFRFTNVIGLCLPAICDEDEIQTALDGFLHDLPLPDPMRSLLIKEAERVGDVHEQCARLEYEIIFSREREETAKETFSLPAKLMLTTIALLCTLGIFGSIIDIIGLSCTWRIGKLLQCFSWYNNARKLVNTQEQNGPLDVMNGLRVICTCSVLVGHIVVFALFTLPIQNYNAIFDSFESPGLAVVYSGFFAVDAFFWMTGVLIGYLLLEQITVRCGRMNWGLAYFHRFWRIAPSMLLAMGIQAILWVHLGSGPLWWRMEKADDECAENWWTVMTFINNFAPNGLGNGCFGQAWFLAVDMQFFVITPIILYLYHKYGGKVGWTILGGLCIIDVVATTLISYSNGYTTVAAVNQNEGEFGKVYNKPYCRVASYAFGLGVGWILHAYHSQSQGFASWIATKVTNCRTLRLLLFILGITCLLYSIGAQTFAYGDIRNGFSNWSQVGNALFLGTKRLSFALGLSSLLLSCLLGKFSLLSNILSAKFWTPFARVSYCTYLTHNLVIFTVYNSIESGIFWTPTNLIMMNIAFIVLSYALGFCISMLIEVPCMNLEKLLIAPHKIEESAKSNKLKTL